MSHTRSETPVLDSAAAAARPDAPPAAAAAPGPDFVRFLGTSPDGRIRSGDVARRPTAAALRSVGWIELSEGQFDLWIARGAYRAEHVEEVEGGVEEPAAEPPAAPVEPELPVDDGPTAASSSSSSGVVTLAAGEEPTVAAVEPPAAAPAPAEPPAPAEKKKTGGRKKSAEPAAPAVEPAAEPAAPAEPETPAAE